MKRLIIFAGLVMLMGTVLSGCYKDVNLPAPALDPNGPPEQLSFKKDIQPILSADCALSGCHVAGAQAPDMELGKAYLDLVNGGFVNTSFPTQSEIYIQINGNKIGRAHV